PDAPLPSRAPATPVLDCRRDVHREALRAPHCRGGLVSSAQVPRGPGQASQRPLLCLCCSPLYLRRGAGPAVGKCVGRGLALCQRPFDSHAGRDVGPAIAPARGGAACLVERQRHSQSPIVARPERAGAFRPGAGALLSKSLPSPPPPLPPPAPSPPARPHPPRPP